MFTVELLREKILSGDEINKEEAKSLQKADLEELCEAANAIREHFCQDGFDICTIINGKSGKCSENCKYCAQAGCYATSVEAYPLVSTEKMVKDARYNAEGGVLRYSIVTSGKRLSKKEIEQVCESIRTIKKEVEIEVCVSFGLLEEEDFAKLKEAGVSRVHNNLETSRRYFPEVCTTHTYDEKIAAIKAAQRAGLSVCSGGIMGIGETMEDRIDMAFTLRELGVNSVPVNMLNPIAGTPLENQRILTVDEMRRIVAVYRFILPKVSIRLAGGRGLMEDKGVKCFQSGANAAISGDMLTTSGITVQSDMQMLQKLGYVPRLNSDKMGNNIDFSTVTACGECCNGCKKKNSGLCKGCIEADGYVPEWAGSGRCKVHACTRQHNVQFCGLCREFPCDKLTEIIHWNPNIIEQQMNLANQYHGFRHDV